MNHSHWYDDFARDYSEQHRHNPPDPDAFHAAVDAHYDTRETARQRREKPRAHGVTYFDTPPQDPRYAVSGTASRYPQLRQEVINSRLAQFEPGVLDDLPYDPLVGPPRGNCCEYANIPPQLSRGYSTLRTLNSEAGHLGATTNRIPLCGNCQTLAQRLAEQYPGLTIYDVVGNNTYQSHCTVGFYSSGSPFRPFQSKYQIQALEMKKQGRSDEAIYIFLLKETTNILQNRSQQLSNKASVKEHEALAAENAASAVQERLRRFGYEKDRKEFEAKYRGATNAREAATKARQDAQSTAEKWSQVTQEVTTLEKARYLRQGGAAAGPSHMPMAAGSSGQPYPAFQVPSYHPSRGAPANYRGASNRGLPPFNQGYR
ncbi:hypothetical protein FB45DRAFT_152143 [Roridomyces roridus]|uniref:Uncharacterized protein n=1 Tax=Roridomyces roridus TaxID=1738132 RepID=A0AAD7F7P4_9AGAR|nr:hypothetical protein FB45DRAFT_152143 [Roridomyces roridus]